MLSPVAMATKRKVMEAEAPTAARASAPHKIPHNDRVNNIVKLLEQIPQNHGHGKKKSVLPGFPTVISFAIVLPLILKTVYRRRYASTPVYKGITSKLIHRHNGCIAQ